MKTAVRRAIGEDMTTKGRSILTAAFLLILCLFTFGCANRATPESLPMTPSLEVLDRSPFTGIPCAAPCWHGLEVGKSNESDIMSVLPTLTFIDQSSIQTYRRPSMPDYYTNSGGPGVEIDAKCINAEQECLTLTTANDMLQEIAVKLNYEMRPDEAIRYLGAPDLIGVAPIGAEIYWCEVYLVWKDARLVLASTFKADEDPDGVERYCDTVRIKGKVPSSLRISEARYLSALRLNGLVSWVGTFFEFSGTIPDN